MDKLLIPCIYLKDGRAVSGFGSEEAAWETDPEALARAFGNSGRMKSWFSIFPGRTRNMTGPSETLKKICGAAEVPVIGAGNVKRMEDVKKLLYAGCRRAVLNFAKPENRGLLEEVSKNLEKRKSWYTFRTLPSMRYAGKLLRKFGRRNGAMRSGDGTESSRTDGASGSGAGRYRMCMGNCWAHQNIQALTGAAVSGKNIDLMEVKSRCRARGIPVNTFESKIAWEDFKLNSDGLVPCIVQDYQTGEVLMLAYMNQESFQMTLDTGKMTYWSRSRQELWTKGLTSGHFQYVKSLTLDCDNDTILAKVSQLGAACHTGNRTCFSRN